MKTKSIACLSLFAMIFLTINLKGQVVHNKAYGDNMVKVDTMANGTPIYALYSGDIDQDGSIDAFDFLIMDPDIQAGNEGYLDSDLDGSGNTDAFDFLFLDPNIQAGISLQRPN